MKKLLPSIAVYFLIYSCTSTSPTQNSSTSPSPVNNTSPVLTTVSQEQITSLITQKCSSCHSTSSGRMQAGVKFDNYQDIVSRASQIKKEVVIEKAMPPNPTTITEEERSLIGQWADQNNS